MTRRTVACKLYRCRFSVLVMGFMLMVLYLLELMNVSPSLHKRYVVGGRGGELYPLLRSTFDAACPILLDNV